MKKAFVIILLFFCNAIFAQKALQKDTLLFNQYITQFSQVLDTDPDSALIIIETCQPITQRINQDIFWYKYYYDAARAYHLLAEYEKGKTQITKALTFAQKLKNNKYILRCNRLLFSFYHRLNDYKKASEYIPILEKGLDAGGYEDEIPGQLYGTITSFFSDLDSPDKCIYYGLKGIKLAEKYNDIKGLLACYNNVGNAYQRINQYKKAKDLFQKQFEIAEKNNRQRNAELALINVCNIDINLGNTQNLGKDLKRFEDYIKANNLGLIKRDSVLYFTAKSVYSYQTGNFDESLGYMKKWETLLHTINDITDLEALYNSYAEVYIAWHKYDKANYYYDKADSIKILANKQALMEYSEELKAKYELKEKEVKLLKQEQELEKSRNRTIILLNVLIVVGILGGFLFWFFRNKQHTTILETKLASQNKERQRISREMHDDLGGNLTSLIYSAHILKSQQPDNQQIAKIANIADDISETINEIVWSLNAHQNKLSNWVFYTKGRLSELLENSDLDFKFEIPENLPERTLSDEQKRNLYLVVKEAVNNTIKHAKATTVSIKMNFEQGIAIQIQDNGIGFNDSTKTKTGSGNGLSNMKSRMEEIDGKISWKNQDGTLVEISLT